jgi:hypothetical protein
LYKNDDNKLESKLIAALKKSSSPIQIGTSGIYNGESFVVIGRCKLTFENETISFFTIFYANNKIGILAVNTGVYSIGHFEALTQEQVNIVNGVVHAKQTNLNFNEIPCVCTNTQTTKEIEVEGNFYFSNTFTEIKYYSFTYQTKSKLIFFKGNEIATNVLLENAISFSELQLQNLRKIEETIIPCTICKNPIKIYDEDNAVVVNCKKCDSNFYYLSHQLKQNGKNQTKSTKIHFELGEVLAFYNHDYTITGICEKEDFTIYKSKWREYCLYHPTEGYLFLNEFDGHWIVVNKLFSNADTTEDFEIIEFDNKQYELYNKYSYKTIYIEGNFPYKLHYNKQLTCLEYIAPPVMVIKEKHGNNINWFAAKHVSQKELQKQSKKNLPYKVGIGAIEDKGQVQAKTIFLVALFCLLFTVVVQFVTNTNKTNKNIVNENYNFPDSVNTVLYSINNVELNNNSSNLNVEVTAAVSNAWFELNIEAINNATGERFYAEQGLEFYSGYDDGEYWKEGTNTEDVTISKIPKGIYTINLIALQEASNQKVRDFNVSITYDTPIFRNFFIVFVGILLIALLAYARSYYINVRRWENSPYYELKYPSTSNE